MNMKIEVVFDATDMHRSSIVEELVEVIAENDYLMGLLKAIRYNDYGPGSVNIDLVRRARAAIEGVTE